MALTALMLAKLLTRLRPGEAIASMGYPDIVLGPEKLQEMLGDKFPELKYREDSKRIAKRHGLKGDPQIADAESFFELKGVSLDVYDIVQERGSEVLCDLNYPIPKEACGQYDYVLDVGTAEHCFNIAQAIINMACLVKVGGTVFHENPFNCGNHGFYGLNPTLYHDFYTDNGFEVETRLVTRDGRTCDVPATKRFQMTGEEVNCFAMARRLEMREITFPTQTKYRPKLPRTT